MKKRMLARMFTFAAAAHEGQFRKNGDPYFTHPISVMYFLKERDEELECIAVGHDLLEDTNTTVDDLYILGMSDRVVKGILALTKFEWETYEEYVDKVMANRDAMIVKQADLKHNSDFSQLKGVKQKDFDRMAKYMEFYHNITLALDKTKAS